MLRLFCDRRLLPERYYVAEEEESMRIPETVLKCVAYLYAKVNRKLRPAGTVFFVVIQESQTMDPADVIPIPYSVTARHVIEAISKNSDDGKVYFRVNRKDGRAGFLESQIKDWIFHPTDPSVDVAVLSFAPSPKDHDVFALHNSTFLTDAILQRNEIGVGDEVFITGLFVERLGEGRNIPIVRVGNLAALADEPIASTMGRVIAHLIEARSIGGLSGSPVFVNLGVIRRIGEQVVHANANPGVFFFLGLVHGHYDEERPLGRSLTNERINMGIALVVPSNKIREVLDHPLLVQERQTFTEEHMAKRNLPTLDASLLARSVVEAAIGEPLTEPKKKARKPAKKAKKRATR